MKASWIGWEWLVRNSLELALPTVELVTVLVRFVGFDIGLNVRAFLINILAARSGKRDAEGAVVLNVALVEIEVGV